MPPKKNTNKKSAASASGSANAVKPRTVDEIDESEVDLDDFRVPSSSTSSPRTQQHKSKRVSYYAYICKYINTNQ